MAVILVADDEPLVRDALHRGLSARGAQVIEACNGREAIELAHKLRPDAVVIDLIMPECDGLDAIAAIRAAHPTMVIIAMSGGGRERNTEVLTLAEHVGADLGLAKGIGIKELVHCLAARFGIRLDERS
jgi:CheY-like chemotaxis protein